MKRTAEFVTPKHPDKLADQIADRILDFFLKRDENARVAVEVLAGHGAIHIIGEVTVADYDSQEASDKTLEVVRDFLKEEGLKEPLIDIRLTAQSGEIAAGVDAGGAGDQGIIYGMATKETANTGEYMSLDYCLARSLCRFIYEQGHKEDGKTQVTVDDGKITTIVASFANTTREDLERLIKEWLRTNPYEYDKTAEPEILANPAGYWSKSGWEADTGLTGRKLAVDNYGGACPCGGGAFSGKDPSKTDRSAAYKARQIALTLLRQATIDNAAKETIRPVIVHVRLAYAIGKAEPVDATAIIAWEDGTTTYCELKDLELYNFDTTPRGIIKALNLTKVKYEPTARWGAFGRPELQLPWEEIDNGQSS